MKKEDTLTQLFTFFKAGYPALSINSAERVRAVETVRRAGWSMCAGRKVKRDSDIDSLVDKVKPHAPKAFTVNSDTVIIHVETLIAAFTTLSATDKNDDPQDVALAKQIGEFLNSSSYPLITWDMVTGFSDIQQVAKIENTTELYEALALLRNADAFPGNAIFVFHDCHSHLNTDDPRYRAMLRSLLETGELMSGEFRRPIVFLQPHWSPHPDITHLITPVDFAMPDDEQLDREVTFVSGSVPPSARSECAGQLRFDLVKAMRGLTQTEAINALSYCVVRHKGWSPECVQTMHRLTAAAFARNEVLELIDPDKLPGANQIGGYENYLEFLHECRECYTPEALKIGLKRPKGCLLLGIPGTGKSMVATAAASRDLMNLPLIKYDFAAVFNQLVGQSEATQRSALRQISARGPCVLWIDEADKAFSGIVGSSGDSGVGQRVFGRLLSWMANENDQAFVIMTMNRIVDSVTGAQIVPVETLRAGRIETTFFTTFPDTIERQEILQIHLVKNGAAGSLDEAASYLTPKQWTELVQRTHEMVGSELEQIVIKAVRMAFRARRELRTTFTELMAACEFVTPVAKLDEANIKAIDRFCKDRAVPVSRPKKQSRFVSGSRSQRHLDVDPSGN